MAVIYCICTFLQNYVADIDTPFSSIYCCYCCYADTDTLYSRIYESIEESDPHSALWRYRTRLSLEHLSCSIQTRSYEILNKFLKQVLSWNKYIRYHNFVWSHIIQEATLRAMQYLPEILKLQRYLFDHFHQQIGQEKALSETIGNYKKTIQKGMLSIFNILL